MMNSPIGWIGGKRALRQEIITRFPQDGVGRYIEVFFGAGWVFFGRKKVPGQLEVINDKDGELVNLFRCINDWKMLQSRIEILSIYSKHMIDLMRFFTLIHHI